MTLGPLTNLAVALDREPSLPNLLAGWVLMGGAYRAPGNTTPTSEWNVHVDPHAAKAVFAAWARRERTSQLPLAMGLDVTERARFVPEHLRHLAVRAGAQPLDAAALGREPIEAVGTVAANPVLRFIVDALRFYFEFHAQYDGFYGAFIHDPFAVAAALDRSLVRTRPGLRRRRERGGPRARHDRRRLARADPQAARTSTSRSRGTPTAFIDRFIDRVGRLAASRAVVAR